MTNISNLVTRLTNVMPELEGVVPRCDPGLLAAILKTCKPVIAKRVVDSIVTMRQDAFASGLGFTVQDLNLLTKQVVDRLEAGLTELPLGYKGVSYNPWGRGVRESLLLLDFFALLRNFTSTFGQRQAILDAGFYWMVNQLVENFSITEFPADKAAQQLLETIISGIKKDSFAYRTVLHRNAYLRAIASYFPDYSGMKVFSMLDIWRDSRFLPYLAKAIDHFCRFGREWKVKDPVPYYRHENYSSWFTPLVAAEQVFLADMDFGCFFAPVQETSWNNRAEELGQLIGISPYVRMYYDRPSVALNRSYSESPTFEDNLPILKRKIEDPAIREWMLQLVSKFVSGHWSIVNNIQEVAALLFDFITRTNTLAGEMKGSEVPACPLNFTEAKVREITVNPENPATENACCHPRSQVTKRFVDSKMRGHLSAFVLYDYECSCGASWRHGEVEDL